MFTSTILLGGELPLNLFRILVSVIACVFAGILFVDEMIGEVDPTTFRYSFPGELPQAGTQSAAREEASVSEGCDS